jgi:hypothetical protein
MTQILHIPKIILVVSHTLTKSKIKLTLFQPDSSISSEAIPNNIGNLSFTYTGYWITHSRSLSSERVTLLK